MGTPVGGGALWAPGAGSQDTAPRGKGQGSLTRFVACPLAFQAPGYAATRVHEQPGKNRKVGAADCDGCPLLALSGCVRSHCQAGERHDQRKDLPAIRAVFACRDGDRFKGDSVVLLLLSHREDAAR